MRDADLDRFIGFTSSYARANFDGPSRLLLRGARSLLKDVRCVRLSEQDDQASPPSAQVWIYVPNGKSRDMPFVRENGFWRLDWARYWRGTSGNPTR